MEELSEIVCDIEREGLEVLLVGLKHPAFIENRFIKALYCGLSLEWIERQAKDRELAKFDLPRLEEMSREELLAAAGLFYGFHKSIHASDYPKTAAFCIILAAIMIEEIELRCQAKEKLH